MVCALPCARLRINAKLGQSSGSDLPGHTGGPNVARFRIIDLSLVSFIIRSRPTQSHPER